MKLPASFAEWVFTLGAIVLSLALLPTLLSPDSYIPWTGSLLTAAILTMYVPAFLSIQQRFSAASVAVSAALWWLIFLTRGDIL